MTKLNTQFSVASHVMTVLGAHDRAVRSLDLAGSVNVYPSFVRRIVSKLVKAGLVSTQRGVNGACSLARPAAEISLLEIYRASETPDVCSVHGYPTVESCHVSRSIKGQMHEVLREAQTSFEQSLARKSLADLVSAVDKAR